jgi:taurine dioxygenase
MQVDSVGAVGAEISGVDLARLDDRAFAEIKQAFLDHLVLFFRDQCLSPEQQVALTRRFGPVLRVPYVAISRSIPTSSPC